MEKGTVLIVDDESAILRSLKALFDRDHHIITAPAAREAVEIMRAQTVHVIVSDYKMPGQDGLSLLIETKKKFPGTIRVLMTAFADMNLVVRALNEGEIHRFISKPYMSFEFRTMLNDCLNLSGILSEEQKVADAERLVILAHDSKISLSTLQIILGTSYRTLSTSSGPELLDYVSKNDVGALVLGVGLEMLDGCTITPISRKRRKSTFRSSSGAGTYRVPSRVICGTAAPTAGSTRAIPPPPGFCGTTSGTTSPEAAPGTAH